MPFQEGHELGWLEWVLRGWEELPVVVRFPMVEWGLEVVLRGWEGFLLVVGLPMVVDLMMVAIHQLEAGKKAGSQHMVDTDKVAVVLGGIQSVILQSVGMGCLCHQEGTQ